MDTTTSSFIPTAGSGVELDFSKLSTTDVDFALFDNAAMLDAEPLLMFEPSGDDSSAASLVPRPYHAKRPHKKSRAGCTNCKRRKVKCSETRPACQACILRKDTCVYPRPPPSVTQSPSSASRSASTPASPKSQALVASSPDSSNRGSRLPSVIDIDPAETVILEPLFRPSEMRDMTDMKLLWFYTTETFSSFSVESRRSTIIEDTLRIKVVQIAFESPFLMQCLLGLSALQLKSLGQDMSAQKSASYSTKAFEGYRNAIQNARPADYPALLAASLLMCALSTEMFRDENKKPLCVIDWMTVWRGIGLIVDLISPKSIQESGLAVLFYRPPIDLEKTFRYIPNNLLFMVSSITPDDVDFPHQQTYYDALKYLGSLYMELQHGFSPILDLRVITFFTFIPKLFIPLAREERPRALIILAHYLTFTKLNRNVWWMQGLADREIDEICSMLGEEWAPLTRVPQKVRQTTDKVEIARTIINNRSWQPDEEVSYSKMQNPRESLRLINDKGIPMEIRDGEWVVLTDPKAVAEARKPTPDKMRPHWPSQDLLSDDPPPDPTPEAIAASTAFWQTSLPVPANVPAAASISSGSTPGSSTIDGSTMVGELEGLNPVVPIMGQSRSSPTANPNEGVYSTYASSPADLSMSATADLPASGGNDKGTPEEKWALMGQINGQARGLEEFARVSQEDEEMTRRLQTE